MLRETVPLKGILTVLVITDGVAEDVVFTTADRVEVFVLRITDPLEELLIIVVITDIGGEEVTKTGELLLAVTAG